VNSGLLATKLRRPALPPKFVQRPHLVRRLTEGLEAGRRITLVSAPAGFGKTTCVGEWLGTMEAGLIGWLSLDAADDDPQRFLAYFLAALQTVDASVGREIEGVLRAGQLPPSEVVGTTLINDILRAEPAQGRFLVVLDDLHVIQDHFVLQILESLIANPPQPLHLVLLTREDPPLPLARLRANNQLTEIRARDLRLSTADAERFLCEVIGLSLSPADVRALEAKTEGWIVGLQLAGLSIRDRADPSEFIAHLSGSHRYILSYLTEEVLARQSQEIQDFLLQTAILDRLSADLCDAVTGRLDSRAVLEQLHRANLFLIALDDEGQWYRYHRLFADLLRNAQHRLPDEKRIDLHRRASQWYADAGGEEGAFLGEAMHHALAAQDYALAVDLLEKHASQRIMRGYAKTVHGWVQAIPAAWASQSPRTDLAFAWMHLLRGAYDQAIPYLGRLEGFFIASRAGEGIVQALEAEWLVLRSLLLDMQGQVAEALALTTHALDLAPQQDSRVRSLAYFAQATAYVAMDEYELAVDAYRMAIEHGRAADNLVAEMMSTSGLAQLAFEHGQLHLAFEIAEPVSARLEAAGSLPPISTVLYGMLAEVLYHWLQIEEARRHSLRALQLSTLGGYKSGIIGCWLLLSRLSYLAGDLNAAAREIRQTVELMQADTPGYVRQEAVAQQVRVCLAQNRPVAAELALQGQGFSFQDRFSFPALPAEQGIPHSAGLLYNSSLRLALYRARSGRGLAGLRTGIELSSRLISGAREVQTLLIELEALLLRAQMHAVLGNTEDSLADCARAVELAEPEGILGLFVEQGPSLAEMLSKLLRQGQLEIAPRRHVERILAAMPSPQPASAAPDEGPPDLAAGVEPAALIEPLTEREVDVLRLVAEGLKYKEVAERLFISLNTVRSHIKAIYGKLNVNNRTQAVEVARQHRIL